MQLNYRIYTLQIILSHITANLEYPGVDDQ